MAWTYDDSLYDLLRIAGPVPHAILCWVLSNAVAGVARFSVRETARVLSITRAELRTALDSLATAGFLSLATEARETVVTIRHPERYNMPLIDKDVAEAKGPSDWSRLQASAQTVLNHYRRVLRRGDDRNESLPTILHWLEAGHTPEHLVAAAEAYLLTKEGEDSKYLRLAQNFYAPGFFEQWLTDPVEGDEEEESDELRPTTKKLREAFMKRKEEPWPSE